MEWVVTRSRVLACWVIWCPMHQGWLGLIWSQSSRSVWQVSDSLPCTLKKNPTLEKFWLSLLLSAVFSTYLYSPSNNSCDADLVFSWLLTAVFTYLEQSCMFTIVWGLVSCGIWCQQISAEAWQQISTGQTVLTKYQGVLCVLTLIKIFHCHSI